MSDPIRLLETGGELERKLLESARQDAPSETSKRAAMLALGLDPPISAPTAGSSTVHGGSAMAPSAVGKIGGVGFKWVVAAVVGGGVAAATFVGRAPVEERPTIESSKAVDVLPPKPVVEPPILPPVSTPEVVEPTQPVSPPARTKVLRATVTPKLEEPPVVEEVPVAPEPRVVASDPRPSGLAQEILIIDQARAQVSAGRAAEALETLEKYGAVHKGGVLAPEAEALRIDAWVLLGEYDKARAAARAFVEAHPQSPLVHRYRTLLEQP